MKKPNYLLSANYIKIKLIKRILKISRNFLIGSEIRFGTKNNYADLVCVINDRTIAFEVKAQNDDLRIIDKQLDAYLTVFDYVYLVTTEKHMTRALDKVNHQVGLIILTEKGNLKSVKDAIKSKNNSKQEILSSVPIKFLKRHYKLDLDSDIRNELIEKNLRNIKIAYCKFLIHRLEKRTALFKNEVGVEYHIEDIKLLSFNPDSRLY